MSVRACMVIKPSAAGQLTEDSSSEGDWSARHTSFECQSAVKPPRLPIARQTAGRVTIWTQREDSVRMTDGSQLPAWHQRGDRWVNPDCMNTGGMTVGSSPPARKAAG
ncbi:hypothetical protein PGT21_026706 [Puccinia graminis f. sp. tritici]|uniref:Uncharacterized protein n=1 Tax=Puccinia graminis f. sp. tritici TaxID=56615 RepID=A0A5B0QPR0_PUCGR|nr:hypothetical protein PGT21_026706 [Puccinia graminis f. sp. tritici]